MIFQQHIVDQSQEEIVELTVCDDSIPVSQIFFLNMTTRSLRRSNVFQVEAALGRP